MQVRDITVFDAVTIEGEEPVSSAARLMNYEGVGMIVVCDVRTPMGVMTDLDVTTRCVAAGHTPGDCPCLHT